jgi:hypothetical protein
MADGVIGLDFPILKHARSINYSGTWNEWNEPESLRRNDLGNGFYVSNYCADEINAIFKTRSKNRFRQPCGINF